MYMEPQSFRPVKITHTPSNYVPYIEPPQHTVKVSGVAGLLVHKVIVPIPYLLHSCTLVHHRLKIETLSCSSVASVFTAHRSPSTMTRSCGKPEYGLLPATTKFERDWIAYEDARASEEQVRERPAPPHANADPAAAHEQKVAMAMADTSMGVS